MPIHVAVHGQQLGVFELVALNAQLAEGTIPADTALAWYEGCPNWIPIAQVPGVILPGPTAAPASPPPLPPPGASSSGDGTGGLIPYKNPKALTAYYLGIFGLFPFIGFLLAVPALILGILGLQARKQNPLIKGAVHAWVGIVLGTISISYHLLGLTAMLVTR
jgi:hypothetical protein